MGLMSSPHSRSFADAVPSNSVAAILMLDCLRVSGRCSRRKSPGRQTAPAIRMCLQLDLWQRRTRRQRLFPSTCERINQQSSEGIKAQDKNNNRVGIGIVHGSPLLIDRLPIVLVVLAAPASPPKVNFLSARHQRLLATTLRLIR